MTRDEEEARRRTYQGPPPALCAGVRMSRCWPGQASTSAGVGSNRVRTKPRFSLFRRNCQVRLSIMDCLIKLDCSGWLWSCLWAHVPQVKVRGWTPLFHIRGRLLIWWRWAVVPPIEGEVALQPVVFWMKRKNASDHEEETEHHEELYLEVVTANGGGKIVIIPIIS